MADSERTRVVFRRYPDGEIIALFPDVPADNRGHISCYVHLGQHGAASYARVIADTRPALPAEYAALRRELEAEPYPYQLDVRTRAGRRAAHA